MEPASTARTVEDGAGTQLELGVLALFVEGEHPRAGQLRIGGGDLGGGEVFLDE